MRIGDVSEATLVVEPSDSARGIALSDRDAFPDVFATSLERGALDRIDPKR